MGKINAGVDLILTGGRIWTENPTEPEVEAIAISGGKIVAAGTPADVDGLRSGRTRIINLQGRRAVPGFNDAHVHFYYGGASLRSVQLRSARSKEEFRDRIAKFAQGIPKGEWILLGEWDPQGWTPPGLPTHELIDDVTPDNPVFVNQVDAHTMLANSVAMKLAGVDRNTADMPGGVIGRHPDGGPNGIFIDAAKSLIERVIPAVTFRQLITCLQAAQAHAFQFGVTSVQDMGFVAPVIQQRTTDLFRAYQHLRKNGDLKIRVALHTPLPLWKVLADLGVLSAFGDETLQIGGLKGFADGSLGSSTAWFLEPYTDNPKNSGGPSDELTEPDGMYATMIGGDSAGLQLAIHAIGDCANTKILDFFDKIESSNGPRDRRFRIEHAQHVHPPDFARFAKMSVVASMQPYHCIDDGRWACGRIGAERAKAAWPTRSLLDAGVRVAFGSDWWVAPIDPLAGIYAATTRRPIDGSHPEGWVPEQKISVKEAVHAYTVGSAFASFQDHVKGSLEPGKLADIAVLSEDIFSMPAEDIARAKVDMTIAGGEVVFDRN
ncbi:MAG: amidohydrolase [Acidobacteriaceae bacterium]